jgi:hypothetical protein
MTAQQIFTASVGLLLAILTGAIYWMLGKRRDDKTKGE